MTTDAEREAKLKALDSSITSLLGIQERIGQIDRKQLMDALVTIRDLFRIDVERAMDDWRKIKDEHMEKLNANREELIKAWIAKTGIDPEDSMIHEQRLASGEVQFWVERRKAPTPPPDAAESDEDMERIARVLDQFAGYNNWISFDDAKRAATSLRARSTECRELKAEVEIRKDQMKFDALLLKAGEAQTEELRAENEKLKFQLEGYIQQNAQLAQPLMSQPASVFHSYIGPAVKEAGE